MMCEAKSATKDDFIDKHHANENPGQLLDFKILFIYKYYQS